MPLVSGLYYETYGPEGGEPVLMSSGLGGSGEYWRPQVDALADRYRVILYDQRGTARSDRELPPDHDVWAMAGDVLIVLEALEIASAHLVGHALGGLIGLALALKSPERLTSLVAVNAWARLSPVTARCFDTRLIILHGAGVGAFIEATPIFLYPALWIAENPERLAREAKHQRTSFPGVETTTRRIDAVRAFDVADRLGEITTPVLSLLAEDDVLVPWSAGRSLTDGLPQGRFAALPRGGHACNVTEPDRFNRLLMDWLADHASPYRN